MACGMTMMPDLLTDDIFSTSNLRKNKKCISNDIDRPSKRARSTRNYYDDEMKTCKNTTVDTVSKINYIEDSLDFLDSSDLSDSSTQESNNKNELLLDLIFEKKISLDSMVAWVPPKNAPYFVYLMCAPVPNPISGILKTGKLQTHVGKGRNPIRKIWQHNKGTLDSKSTRAGAPNWELVCFIGPFPSKKDCLWFFNLWRKSRRNLQRRRNFILLGEFMNDEQVPVEVRTTLKDLVIVKNEGYHSSRVD